MSRIDDLIAEHCPDGVEYLPLSDVVLKNTGGGTPSKKVAEYWDGSIPWASVGDLSSSELYLSETRNSITEIGVQKSSTNIIPAGSLIVAVKISPGLMRYAAIDTAINQDLRGLEIKPIMDPFFLNYYFKTVNIVGNGTIVKGITNSALMATKVPVPPICVQEEIVRVLDKFTQLEAELEAELEARRRQYEYYRDALLTFTKRGGVRLLGDIANIYGGLVGKSKSDFENGGARFVPYVNVFANPGVNLDQLANVSVSRDEKQNCIAMGDVLLTSSSENLDEVAMSSVVLKDPEFDVYLNSFCFGVRFDNRELFDPRFLKHLFRSRGMRKQLIKTASGVTRFNVSKTRIKKIQIPIPDLQFQQEVADVLDPLEALGSDIFIGLPAELQARRKQYEYYRDKLLTFKEKA